MTLVYLMDPGYRYAGETVELAQAITAKQFRAIEEILGISPGRFKSWAEHFSFEPFGPRQADALRAYLRRQGIAHSTERLDVWRADDREPCAGADPVRGLLEDARRHGLRAEELAGATRRAAGEMASRITSRGIAAQIEYLVRQLGPTGVRDAIKRAARRTAEPVP